MDGSGDALTLLKKLDELEIKDYSPQRNVASNSLKGMATSVDPGMDSNASDFDDSDEDLANLLDDDDDIFAKKVLGTKSPTKSSVPDVTSAATVKAKNTKTIASPNLPLDSPAKEITTLHKAKTASKDEFGDDVLDQFLESSLGNSATADFKLPSPEKSNTKRNSFQSEDTDFLDDLDINEFSPSRDFSNKSPIKKTKSIDKSLDDLNSNNSTPKTPEGRRGSFFDDFLQTLSPKKTAAEEKSKINEENEEDILGVYIPTTPKKNDNASDAQLKSPKRKSSLKKQVSFKNLLDEFSENDISVPKTRASPEQPEKDILKQTFPETKMNESTTRIRRSDKTSSDKSDDVDWLNYFKDTPKKPAKSTKKSSDNLEKADIPVATKPKPAMRRQSSADWLGLSDTKLSDDENDKNLVSKSQKEEVIPTITPIRPKTANVPLGRHRRQDLNKSMDKWDDIGSNGFLKSTSQPATEDLSQILKNADQKQSEKKTKLPESFIKSSPKTENADAFSSSRIIKDSKTASSPHRIKKSDDFISDNVMISEKESVFEQPTVIAQSRNLQGNYELTSALQSVQSMLDDSIRERNKLLKENEDIKKTLEEKIKTSEEFYKSEKKMLEDSFKTVESSLKKEFEIKIKSYDERMSFISDEKEKQARFFEEKLQTILKDHQLEVQKLKDLHSQSISIMKQDHEDAILRLKRLKEQEIEAVLSTQAHSKSLQYLSDQLEARANEMSSLQNKLEERNQATLRERQTLLDTKEKDLKALENRLHRQLEDSEAERTRLQQLVLRLESRLQKITMEGEEEHWETKQLKAKLTVQQKYLEEEQKISQYQLEKEKEKLKISQESLLNEQRAVLIQLAQERQLLSQEKIELQSTAKKIREEEAKFSVKKLKEETFIESEKQFVLEEKNKLHFEKEKIKQEFYQLERERDSLQREKQQIKKEREMLHEQEMNLKRKESQIEDLAAAATLEQDKGHREYVEALAIKKEQEFKMKQYTQQMQMLMNKEQQILSEREKLMTEKMEFEQNKSSAVCIKCKLSIENPVQVSSPQNLSMPLVFPLPNMNGSTTQVQQSFIDPNLVIWHISAQKDREFLQEELAYLKSLKDSSKRKYSK